VGVTLILPEESFSPLPSRESRLSVLEAVLRILVMLKDVEKKPGKSAQALLKTIELYLCGYDVNLIIL